MTLAEGWKGFGMFPKIEKQKAGVELIAEERFRQESQEGWTPEHDDSHAEDELARAAACYALPHFDRMRFTGTSSVPVFWPWDDNWWKPAKRSQTSSDSDRIKELVKAGALIAAEIDRLNRKAQ